MNLLEFYGVLLLSSLAYCQVYPWFEHQVINNSYIHHTNISSGQNALKCTIKNANCCSEYQNGNWRDEEGIHIMTKETVHSSPECFYVTRKRGAIILHHHHRRECTRHKSGLWTCEILDSSGEIQTLFIYIAFDYVSGKIHTKTCIIKRLLIYL